MLKRHLTSQHAFMKKVLVTLRIDGAYLTVRISQHPCSRHDIKSRQTDSISSKIKNETDIPSIFSLI